MIVVRIIMNALPEKQKEIMQTLLTINAPKGKESGYLSYGIYRDIEDRNIFNLISEWESRQNLDNYMRSECFSVLLGAKSLLCEPPEIHIYTVSRSEAMEAVEAVRSKRSQ